MALVPFRHHTTTNIKLSFVTSFFEKITPGGLIMAPKCWNNILLFFCSRPYFLSLKKRRFAQLSFIRLLGTRNICNALQVSRDFRSSSYKCCFELFNVPWDILNLVLYGTRCFFALKPQVPSIYRQTVLVRPADLSWSEKKAQSSRASYTHVPEVISYFRWTSSLWRR